MPRNGSASQGVRRLPDRLVDQIAAGEVVERPASVVKELVENALDAEARRLRVEVRDGGRALLAVVDDGVGMSPEDARLALERHATSKLRQAEDLGRILTFGFRGEALPAIAAVSRLRLRTRARGAEAAFELRLEAGRVLESRTVGGPEGTRVEVADLFAGIPARRKFLKSAATEWGHVVDWLARVALARAEVHFEIRRDDRAVTAWPATSDPLTRAAAVLSEREAEGLVAGAREEGRAGLSGLFSRPDAHRPTAAGLYLYVNGRPVRDRLLRHAVLESYRDVLPRGRYPTALVFLTLPPESVDVNVHPAKWEVRFHDPRAIHRLVEGAVRDAIASRGWIRRVPPPGPLLPTHKPQPGAGGDWIFAEGPEPAQTALVLADAATGPAGEPPRLRFSELRPLGQLLGSYLVVEDKEGLVLVDQHAAHERVLYERLREAWRAQGVQRQALLQPEVVELAPTGRAALEAAPDVAERLGFEIEPFDAASVAVRAIPALLAGHDPAALVRGLADELAQTAALATRVREDSRLLDSADRILASLACHSARTAGEVLDAREQRALLEALDTIPWSPTCPHGRPVAVPLPLVEIERRFGRH